MYSRDNKNPQNMGKVELTNLSVIRRSIQSKELSEQAKDILLSSWREKTTKQYECYLRKWETFCGRREVDPFSTTVNNVLEFLTFLYQSGIGYSGINTARSALSSVVTLVDAVHYPVGQHPLIKRFLKGVFNKKPSFPRYSEIWDVSVVFNWMKTIDFDNMCLKLITLKTTMLLALLSGQRIQTLKTLSLKNLKLTDFQVEFRIDSLLKQSRPGFHLHKIELPAYEDRSLCIVKHLRKYIDMTREIRSTDSLLISYQKPHAPVSCDTIARWLKSVLHRSGVDINVYTAHSTRAASTSCAVSMGCPIDNIMAQVGWSKETTFAKYYNKKFTVENISLGQTLLKCVDK